MEVTNLNGRSGLVMNTGLQNKHIQKRKLKNEIRKKCTELKRTCFHEINLALKSKLKKIIKSHQTKLINLRRQQNKNTFGVATTHIKHTIHNFSLYQLPNDKLTALWYSLDHHIPSKFNRNRIYIEFEQFYQSLLKDISHVTDEDLSHLKTKLRNTCDKYNQIHVPYKHKQIIEQLSNDRNICIIRQDKGRGVAIVDISKYTGKHLELLETNQFLKLKHNSTKSFENEIQRTLRKLKTRLSTQQYYQ